VASFLKILFEKKNNNLDYKVSFPKDEECGRRGGDICFCVSKITFNLIFF